MTATPATGADIVPSPSSQFGHLSFAQLRASVTPVAVIDGAQLEREKSRLIGVPHIITRATYRPGVTTENGPKDYVSLEAVIADADTLLHALRSGRIPGGVPGNLDSIPVQPEERIVFNDGSTGIRRQTTHILHNCGLIQVANVGNDMSAFDAPYWEWLSFDQTGLMNGDTEDEKIEVPDFTTNKDKTAPFVIQVLHGLRDSVEPKFNKTVFYLS